VVRYVREAEAAGSPCASVIIIAERVHGLLPCKVPPLALELCLGGLHVHLPSAEAVHLLKVGRAVAGTLVQWCEPRRLLRLNLTVDVVAHARRVVVVDVVRVVLQAIP
jgi:hypothetical protein